MRINQPKKIVISRTDSIGDVALTLPVAGILKEKYPDAHIVFLGNTYTKPIIDCCSAVDEVWEWADIQNMTDPEQISWLKKQNVDVFIHVFPRRELARLAQKAKIRHRIGTSHRLYHLMTCNHRINFTRKNSSLHEAQLNIKLLKPFGIDSTFSLNELSHYALFKNISPLSAGLANLISKDKINVVFHPKSKGSALEWGVDNFIALAQEMDSTQYQIFFTGTEEESKYFRSKLPAQSNITDLSGKLSLPELIAFINASDMLLACSTGPLHIAGLCNIKTIGLFTPRKPLHFGRWQPLGLQVKIIEEKEMSDRDQPLNINLRVVKKEIENFK